LVKNCVLAMPVGKVGAVRSLFVLLGLVVFHGLFELVARPLMIVCGTLVLPPCF
jgi:hypothetical protein